MKDSLIVKNILSKKQQLITKEYRDNFGLTGAGIGYKISKGVKTNEESLVFFVQKKKPLSELEPNKILPSAIEGIKCDVVEMPEFTADSFTAKVRPAAPGYSCGHYLVTAGTLGCVVYKGSTRYILSNNHVLANCNNASIGDPIRQPGTADGGTSSDVVAYLDSFITLEDDVKVDCALAEITNNSLVTDTGQWGYPILSYSSPALNDTVYKTGRTTETTSAAVIYVHAGVNCNYGGTLGTIYIDDCFITNVMSSPGDSGSIGRSNNTNAVGILFSGNDTLTAYCYMTNVITSLGFTFCSFTPGNYTMELYNTSLFSDSNLKGYYRFEGDVLDSKNSNYGTAYDITYNVTNGKYNYYASFNGTSSYSALGTWTGLNCSSAVSLYAWIYPANVSGYKSIIHDATNGGAHGQYGLNLSSQKLRFQWGNGTTSATYESTDNVITTANTWYPVIGVRDSSGNVTLYVNGAEVAGSFTTGSNATPVYANPQGVSIGRYGAYSGDYFNGYIDDAAIFNRALNSTDVYILSNIYGIESSNICWWY